MIMNFSIVSYQGFRYGSMKNLLCRTHQLLCWLKILIKKWLKRLRRSQMLEKKLKVFILCHKSSVNVASFTMQKNQIAINQWVLLTLMIFSTKQKLRLELIPNQQLSQTTKIRTHMLMKGLPVSEILPQVAPNPC